MSRGAESLFSGRASGPTELKSIRPPGQGSEPAERGQGGQVLAGRLARDAVDLVDPLGAITLGRAVPEPAGIVGAVLQGGQAGQPPLGRGEAGPGDALDAVSLA